MNYLDGPDIFPWYYTPIMGGNLSPWLQGPVTEKLLQSCVGGGFELLQGGRQGKQSLVNGVLIHALYFGEWHEKDFGEFGRWDVLNGWTTCIPCLWVPTRKITYEPEQGENPLLRYHLAPPLYDRWIKNI
jgi:hypothetical protein